MRTAVTGAAFLLAGVVTVAVGAVPLSVPAALFDRVWPILLFVIAITVTTELAADAGVFRSIAQALASAGRGRALVLWLLVVGFATASTVFLSLDTTAVLLTPIVVILARHVGLDPIPFALTTVWLANTGSLLLPVSNLTNLLAEHELGGIGAVAFASATALPALVAILVPTLAIAIVYRRALAAEYVAPDRSVADDPVLFRCAAGVLLLLVPALVTPIPVWVSASSSALLLSAVFALRRRRSLRPSLIPWQLALFASGLFLIIECAQSLGLADLLLGLTGSGESPLSLLRLAGVGTVAANLGNNLPAYLALEPLTGSVNRVVALLIGVNVGPLITPWASLATLLWHERLVKLGVELSWWRYAALGAIVAPVTVAASVACLALRS